MKQIPEEIIDKQWQELNEMAPEDARDFMDIMAREQPYLVAYLLAAEEGPFTEQDKGMLLMLGALVWKIMSSTGDPVPHVTGDEIDAAEETNLQFLQGMGEESEIRTLEVTRELFANYNQQPLLGAILEIIMEGNEENPELMDENRGLWLLYMKTVIDCLDR